MVPTWMMTQGMIDPLTAVSVREQLQFARMWSQIMPLLSELFNMSPQDDMHIMINGTTVAQFCHFAHQQGVTHSLPVVVKPSPATQISSLVSKPTAGLEHVARKERTMNSYSRVFSAFQPLSPAVCLVG